RLPASTPLLVPGRGEFVHRVNEGFGVIRVDVLVDAVAEVEDVTAALAVGGQDARHFLADAGGRRVEHGRIHVALQGNTLTDALTRAGNVDGPVEADTVRATAGDGFEPQATVLGE